MLAQTMLVTMENPHEPPSTPHPIDRPIGSLSAGADNLLDNRTTSVARTFAAAGAVASLQIIASGDPEEYELVANTGITTMMGVETTSYVPVHTVPDVPDDETGTGPITIHHGGVQTTMSTSGLVRPVAAYGFGPYAGVGQYPQKSW